MKVEKTLIMCEPQSQNYSVQSCFVTSGSSTFSPRWKYTYQQQKYTLFRKNVTFTVQLESFTEMPVHLCSYWCLEVSFFGRAPHISYFCPLASSSPGNSPYLYINWYYKSNNTAGPICHGYALSPQFHSFLRITPKCWQQQEGAHKKNRLKELCSCSKCSNNLKHSIQVIFSLPCIIPWL